MDKLIYIELASENQLEMPRRQLPVDLHTHSTASDGSLTPAELVRHAKQNGLAAIALTDHDTLDGVEEALREGKKLDFEVVPGVEISVDFDPEMHILGYFFEGDHSGIKDTLAELREWRNERNPRIIKRLNELGIDITLDEVEKIAAGGITGRPHIARAMIEKGYAADVQEAFDKYLASGRPAYFKKDKLTPEEGIAAIKDAGGLPVLAHPVLLGMEKSELEKLFIRLANAGLVGAEAYYTENTAGQTDMLVELAQSSGLLLTGGSDFHGSFKPQTEIGKGRGNLDIPYSLLEGLKRRALAKGSMT